jgi:hypothetical protein
VRLPSGLQQFPSSKSGIYLMRLFHISNRNGVGEH